MEDRIPQAEVSQDELTQYFISHLTVSIAPRTSW